MGKTEVHPGRTPLGRRTLTLIVTGALLIAGAASAAEAGAARDGTYRGLDQGEAKVVLKVKNGRITKFTGTPLTSCGSAGTWLSTFAFPPSGRKGATIRIKGNGSFATVFKGTPGISFKDDNRTLSGRFKGSRVTGFMKIQGLCSAFTKFSARLR
jgi:hypothetical protein